MLRPACAGTLATLAALAHAPAALAGKPKGEYAIFRDCPLASKGVNKCVYATFTGGELLFDKVDIPIKRTSRFRAA